MVIPAESERTEVIANVDALYDRFVAQITGDVGLLDVDDKAYAAVPPVHPTTVALVTDGSNLFLEAALLTHDDHIQLRAVTPSTARSGLAEIDADIVVFDVGENPLPPTLPNTDLVLFDPGRLDPLASPIPIHKTITRPVLTYQLKEHPLMQGVVLKDVNLARATSFRPSPSDTILVRSFDEPIAVVRQDERITIAFGFDPRQTDLPLRVAFPNLIHNAISFIETGQPGFVASTSLGSQVISLRQIGVEDGGGQVTMRSPSGNVDVVPVESGGRIHASFIEVGFHLLSATDDRSFTQATIAVNNGDPTGGTVGRP